MGVNAAAKADKSQERFYAALRDLFVGAAVEGQSATGRHSPSDLWD